MDDIDPTVALRPGCYGIGLLYRETSTECTTCPFAVQCGPVAQAQLAALRAELGIKVATPRAKIVSTPVSPATRVYSKKLPPKVIELLNAIDTAGIRVGEALKNGLNPFTVKFPFLRIACHLLMRRQGKGISRDEMRHAFETTLKVGRGTADAYALQASIALRAIGVANERESVLYLKEGIG